MGYSSGPCCIDSRQKEEDLKSQNGAKIQATAASPNRPSLINEASEFDTRVRTLVQKMVWEFGLGLGLGLSCVKKGQRKAALKQQQENERDSSSSNEHNKAWLLAESGGGEQHFDSQSVHSSFRFSFGSQLDHDLNSHSASSSSSVAAVLMVNLDNGLRESLSRDSKWRRIESLERSISPVAHTLVRYTYSEIRSATRNFSKGRFLGRGALSYVYRGRFGFRRTAVAIKRLDKEDKESAKAFCRELMIASSLRNRNIVPLLGFCIDPDEGLFLIYKYVSGGSLEYHLHEKQRGLKGCSSLPWSVRYKVALEIAEAVEYLHNGTDRCVVHRDIKPSNILLSSKKIPKLCDFGLATWTPGPSVPLLCKTVKGTFGYLAPEYFQHGKVSDKTDVFAFGVVLLELLTGRKPFDDRRAPGEENLVLWAKPILQKGESIEVLIDRKLKLRPHNSRQVTRMVQAAAACISSEESRRPNIDNVISILRGEENYCLTRSKSTFSENSCVLDCYPHLHDLQSKGDMRSHFALAMLGVSDIEADDHYLYCR